MSDYQPITENGRFKAAYIEPHNPHLSLTPGPKGKDRVWTCDACGKSGKFNDVVGTECTAPMPAPCKACGLTPICARDCPGIRAEFGRDDVYVVDGQG